MSREVLYKGGSTINLYLSYCVLESNVLKGKLYNLLHLKKLFWKNTSIMYRTPKQIDKD